MRCAHCANNWPPRAGPLRRFRWTQAQEQQAVDKARIDEMAQSKVESAQKFPLRITGMALFNAYANGRFNGNAENVTIASLTRADATGGGTLRQSILGVQFESPQNILGGKVTGSCLHRLLRRDRPDPSNHLVRLRTATISLDWSQTTLLFGQDKPIISPRDPNSLAQVGVSPLTAAGNLWLWQPQIACGTTRPLWNHGGPARASGRVPDARNRQ